MVRADFERRRRSNARFSVRAFALVLGVDSASLSQIMRGRRRLSARAAEALATRLAVAPAERDATVNESLRSGHERRLLRQIAAPGFVPSSRRLARQLRLRTDDVNAALARLLRTGRLTMLSPTRWVVTPEENESCRTP
ncbi:MAG TPA: helix-turn-helix transcriptional regulator [Candidatus Elarobacter sp.]|jgi:transcriptional regulator with XRE-family HTH domain